MEITVEFDKNSIFQVIDKRRTVRSPLMHGKDIHVVLKNGDIIALVKADKCIQEDVLQEDVLQEDIQQEAKGNIMQEWSLRNLVTYVIFYEHGINLLEKLNWNYIWMLELRDDKPELLSRFMNYYAELIDSPNYFLHLILLECVKYGLENTSHWIKETYSKQLKKITLDRSLLHERTIHHLMIYDDTIVSTELSDILIFTKLMHHRFGSLFKVIKNYINDKHMWELCFTVMYHNLPTLLNDVANISDIISLQQNATILGEFLGTFFRKYPNLIVPTLIYLIRSNNLIVFEQLLQMNIPDQKHINEVNSLVEQLKWITIVLEKTSYYLPEDKIQKYLVSLCDKDFNFNMTDVKMCIILEKMMLMQKNIDHSYNKKIFECLHKLNYEVCVNLFLALFPKSKKFLKELEKKNNIVITDQREESGRTDTASFNNPPSLISVNDIQIYLDSINQLGTTCLFMNDRRMHIILTKMLKHSSSKIIKNDIVEIYQKLVDLSYEECQEMLIKYYPHFIEPISVI